MCLCKVVRYLEVTHSSLNAISLSHQLWPSFYPCLLQLDLNTAHRMILSIPNQKNHSSAQTFQVFPILTHSKSQLSWQQPTSPLTIFPSTPWPLWHSVQLSSLGSVCQTTLASSLALEISLRCSSQEDIPSAKMLFPLTPVAHSFTFFRLLLRYLLRKAFPGHLTIYPSYPPFLLYFFPKCLMQFNYMFFPPFIKSKLIKQEYFFLFHILQYP